MARVNVELGLDNSDYINGIRQATTETERYGNSLENTAQRAWELERVSQRNMPGFNSTTTNAAPTIHSTFEANENLRAYNDLGLRIDELKNAIVKANALQKEALEDGDLQKAFFASSSINQMEQEKARLRRISVGPGKETERVLLAYDSTPLKSGATLAELLTRPELSYEAIEPLDSERPSLPPAVTEQVEIDLRYAGYIERQERL